MHVFVNEGYTDFNSNRTDGVIAFNQRLVQLQDHLDAISKQQVNITVHIVPNGETYESGDPANIHYFITRNGDGYSVDACSTRLEVIKTIQIN